jgi:hypothetical protein
MITLRNTAPDGEELEAIYAPEKGMNLVSYRKGSIQVIDQQTTPLFEERCAGLGALIGPHFYEQSEPPSNYAPSLFPHVAKMQAQGRKDPFSHGIARYVPWKYASSETQIQAELRGTDLIQNTPLTAFEGQDFHMKYEARLLPDGLFISVAITSEKPSLVGLHYYYVFSGKGSVQGQVQNTYRDQANWNPLPASWTDTSPTHLNFTLPQKADYGFIPAYKTETDHEYHVQLNTENYSLHFEFNTSSNEEVSFQVFHPENASYVCVEPLSARFPPGPKLSQSKLETKLQIYNPLQTT